MIRNTKRAAVLIIGLFFLLLGVVGLVLPLLQGVLFIAIGAVLLSLLSPTISNKIDDWARPYPRVYPVVARAQRFVRRVVGEV